MSEAETLLMLYPRAAKLMRRGQVFLVVGEHEPYYMSVYSMIRAQERRQGTWTEEDERIYREAERQDLLHRVPQPPAAEE